MTYNNASFKIVINEPFVPIEVEGLEEALREMLLASSWLVTNNFTIESSATGNTITECPPNIKEV